MTSSEKLSNEEKRWLHYVPLAFVLNKNKVTSNAQPGAAQRMFESALAAAEETPGIEMVELDKWVTRRLYCLSIARGLNETRLPFFPIESPKDWLLDYTSAMLIHYWLTDKLVMSDATGEAPENLAQFQRWQTAECVFLDGRLQHMQCHYMSSEWLKLFEFHGFTSALEAELAHRTCRSTLTFLQKYLPPIRFGRISEIHGPPTSEAVSSSFSLPTKNMKTVWDELGKFVKESDFVKSLAAEQVSRPLQNK